MAKARKITAKERAATAADEQAYQARPLDVQAIQYTGENVGAVAAFLAPVGGPFNPTGASAERPISVQITCGPQTGQAHALVAGEWVVLSDLGLEVFTAAEFAARFVAADEAFDDDETDA